VLNDPFDAALRTLGDGLDDDATRLALAQQYSYVFPDAKSLALLATLGPLVEMGAGTGYWAAKLRERGVDIVAFDQAPPDGHRVNRYNAPTPTWTEVLMGDMAVLSRYPDRVLFLCWPPLFSSLGDCLSYYTGNTVACIGDGGHRTSRLRTLDDTFALSEAHPVRAVDPAPEAIATLSVWRRTQRGVVASSP
jgi:hypothetical protein